MEIDRSPKELFPRQHTLLLYYIKPYSHKTIWDENVIEFTAKLYCTVVWRSIGPENLQKASNTAMATKLAFTAQD